MRTVVALAIFGTMLPAAARAEETDTAHDVQCLIASSFLAEEDDGNIQNIGMSGTMFFAGRIFATDPDIDLTAAVKAQMPSMDPATIEALQTECGTELLVRGREVIAAAEALGEAAPADDTH